MTLRTIVNCSLEAFLEGAAVAGNIPDFALKALSAMRWESGTAANKADKLYFGELTINASSSTTLDLTNLTDPLGAALAFAKVRAILLEADAGNANNVEVGSAASNQFLGWFKDANDIDALAPGDRIMKVSPTAGKTVSDGASDSLKLANSGAGTSVKVRIAIIGTSA